MKSDGNPDTLEFYVTTGYGNDGCLKVYMSPSIADEVRALFDEHGLAHSRSGEYSQGNELIIASVEVIQTAGGLTALGYIIRTLVHRHDGKKFRFDRNAGTVDAEGYSEEEVTRLLEKTAQMQAKVDAQWQKELDALKAREAATDDQQPDQ
ncbi:hypothetical protein ABT304_05625 [Nocardioides sp. NPDC000445]|uniref:hypothetical protein n=1 Tax=Nocardioides sp. NPDC000445 TaxID=3154257 RepID=UPI00331FF38E